jgi:hypothetical protein
MAAALLGGREIGKRRRFAQPCDYRGESALAIKAGGGHVTLTE